MQLFARDTSGARPTAAGSEMVEDARHILGHLEGVFGRSRSAALSDSMSVGTISSLAMLLFPALHVAVPDLRISQVVDHGPRLVEWVAEGSLDAAFIAIAGQMELPKGVTSRVVGVDRIGILVPASCDLRSSDRRQFAGRTVITYTIDYSGEELDRRVVALGASPLQGGDRGDRGADGATPGLPRGDAPVPAAGLPPRQRSRARQRHGSVAPDSPWSPGSRSAHVLETAHCPSSVGSWDSRAWLLTRDRGAACDASGEPLQVSV